jgi:hypothetical protein
MSIETWIDVPILRQHVRHLVREEWIYDMMEHHSSRHVLVEHYLRSVNVPHVVIRGRWNRYERGHGTTVYVYGREMHDMTDGYATASTYYRTLIDCVIRQSSDPLV